MDKEYSHSIPHVAGKWLKVAAPLFKGEVQ